jgi:hypothetical protein
MKKIIAYLFIISAMCSSAFAQSRLSEFVKAKEIKLLESTRDDVKRILADYESNDSDAESFSTENADIKISYSTGNCSNDDNSERWNIPKGKVKFIKISFNNSIKIKDIRLDFSNFQKERKYDDIDDLYIYRNKNLGIAFEVNENEVETIFLFPPISNYSLLCNNETGKEFYLSERWSEDSELWNSTIPVCVNHPANVDNLILSAAEITIGCNGKDKSCLDSDREISVTTVASDPENDVLTFNYTVSGGKIVGDGSKVVWDLWGVQPGTYTITAGVDDGCGICGPTKTQTVVVKECLDCR